MEYLKIRRQNVNLGPAIVCTLIAILIPLLGGGTNFPFMFLIYLAALNWFGYFRRSGIVIFDEFGIVENDKYKIKWQDVVRIKKVTNFAIKFETTNGGSKSIGIFDIDTANRKRILNYLELKTIIT